MAMYADDDSPCMYPSIFACMPKHVSFFRLFVCFLLFAFVQIAASQPSSHYYRVWLGHGVHVIHY